MTASLSKFKILECSKLYFNTPTHTYTHNTHTHTHTHTHTDVSKVKQF